MRRIGVVGCGVMGSGIAELCARSGLDVVVRALDDEASRRGAERLEKVLRRTVRRDKLSDADAEAVRGRLTFTESLADLVECELVIEAVPEVEAVKLAVFRDLDEVFGDRAVVLASNTSSLSIGHLAAATQRPERVIGMHFFNPVSVLPLVEVVSTAHTAPAVAAAAEELLVGTLGKTAVHVRDTAGFIVNALLIPFICSAIRMVETGVAPADIDLAMTLGCSHPMGPLRLADLIGLDTVASIAGLLYAASGNSHDAPPPLLERMVAEGKLGDKSGGGFYSRGSAAAAN